MENDVKPSEATHAQEPAPAQNEATEVRPERRIRKSLMAKYPDFKAESDDEWASREDEYFGEVEDEMERLKQTGRPRRWQIRREQPDMILE